MRPVVRASHLAAFVLALGLVAACGTGATGTSASSGGTPTPQPSITPETQASRTSNAPKPSKTLDEPTPERTTEEPPPESEEESDSDDLAVPWRDLGEFAYSVPGSYDCAADAGYGCGVMLIRANVDCPTGVYIKVAHYSGMTIVGFQNSSTGPIAAGETVRLDFPWTEAGDTGGGFGQDWDLTDDWGCS